jgi:hypothetical protein
VLWLFCVLWNLIECAATAMEALQGYRFDENDRDSPSLKLQFSRFSNASEQGQEWVILCTRSKSRSG